MKKFLITFLFSLLIISQSLAETIKIGVVAPLTGPVANWGKDIASGIKLGNQLLAGGKYELIFEDDKCDPKEAVSIAHKLVDIDKVKYAVGFACSGPLLAAAPVYEKAQVLAIAAAASASKVSYAGDFIFRIWPSDLSGIKTLTEYIRKKHKHIGVLSEQTEYALGLQQGMEKFKGDLKLETYEFTPGSTDFRTHILKLKQKKVDGIFLNPQADLTLIPMLMQLKQLGVNLPIYTMYYATSESLMSQASELINNIEFADMPDLGSLISAEGKKVTDTARSQYGIGFSGMLVLTAYESFRALDSAISSGEEVRKHLYNSRFNGTFGPWSFDSNGDISGLNFVIKKVKNKEIITLSN